MKNQLNLKLNQENYNILEIIARDQNLKITSLATSIFIGALNQFRIQRALELYQNGEIGLKEAWNLSGLSFIDFLEELKLNEIEPPISKEIDEYTEKIAQELEF